MVGTAKPEIIYPERDGKPLSDNTKQFRWIALIKWNIEAIFMYNPQVFIAADLLWYPKEGDPTTRIAPDTMVVFGRPKGDRGSYLQWKEGNITPQVVFEILSPGNTKTEMRGKLNFYNTYGVEEYYIYDPDNLTLEGYIREGSELKRIPEPPLYGWVSPRLGISFELDPRTDEEMRVYRPDGTLFASFTEVLLQKELAEQRAEKEHQRAEQEYQRAEFERGRVQQERQRTEQERQRAEQEYQRAERLLAKLRALNIEIDE